MAYSGSNSDARKLLDAILAGREYDEAEWLELHLSRNIYNVGYVASLTEQADGSYLDPLGRRWRRVGALGNVYHSSWGNAIGSSLGLVTPFSMKFLCPDDQSGLEGEYEIIVRTSDGARLTARNDAVRQETYNFGRTENFWQHKKLDMDPHGDNGGYYGVSDHVGNTRVVELPEPERTWRRRRY